MSISDLSAGTFIYYTTTNPARGHEKHDKLDHVRPRLDRISGIIKREYNPHVETSIDEAMVAYSGPLGFKQCVPLKSTKRDSNIWVRADPDNGYMNASQVYTGRVDRRPEKDLGIRIETDQMLMGLGHHLYCDSYFTSPALFTTLLKEDTHACGTVRPKRKGLAKELQCRSFKQQGDSEEYQKGEMRATAWRDKRQLQLLSTYRIYV